MHLSVAITHTPAATCVHHGWHNVCIHLCAGRYTSMGALEWNLSQNSEYFTLCAKCCWNGRETEWNHEANYVPSKGSKRSYALDQTKTRRQGLLLSKAQRNKEHWDHTMCYSTIDLKCLTHPPNVSSNWCDRRHVSILLTFNWQLCHSNLHGWPSPDPGFEPLATSRARKAALPVET